MAILRDADGNRVIQQRHIIYGAILLSSGMTWEDSVKRVLEVLASEGHEVSYRTIEAQLQKWMRKNGKAYSQFLSSYLTSFEKVDILNYLLVDMFRQYEEAKVNKDSSLVLRLARQIQDTVMNLHRLSKAEGAADEQDELSKMLASFATAGKYDETRA